MLAITMKKEEYDKFMESYSTTLCRSRSEYARKLLFGKPVKVISRNRSLDDFIEIGVKIRKDLKLLLSKDMFSEAEKQQLKLIVSSIDENLINLVKSCKRR